MDAPIQDLERFRSLLSTAKEHLTAGRLEDAERFALDAQALDRNNPAAPALRADISRALGHKELADQHAAQAKALREQAWKRSVEAEARGHHDVLGEAARRELP